VLYYLLQVIISSGILYGYYHFFLRNNRFHLYNRFYLLAATVVSVIVPLLDIPVYLGLSGNQSSTVPDILSVISTAGSDDSIIAVRRSGAFADWFTRENLAAGFYLLISFIVLSRILVSLLKIRKIIRGNPAEQIGSIQFVNTTEPGTPFSFFRWLFWNRNIELQSQKGEQVFRHELFHIKQKHSWDIIYTELLTVVFWINPFFHLVKKEIKAIHEFLADQFAATENTKWQYAEMLLMHALHTKQHLVNPFFHNQIKRRIAMITTSQKPPYQYLRKMMVLPVIAITVALFAFSYKNKQETRLSKPITVVIDAGHGGEDAGAIAGDGTAEKDITLAIARKIESLNTDKNIRIIQTRSGDNRTLLPSIIEMTKKYNADLFISIHTNAQAKNTSDLNGFTLVISGNNKSHERENILLAGMLLNQFSRDHTVDKNILQRDKGVYILDNAPCPAVIAECGYLTNPKDLDYIKSASGQEEIALAVLKSIVQYGNQDKTVRLTEKQLTLSDTIQPLNKPTELKTATTPVATKPVEKNQQSAILIREEPVKDGSMQPTDKLLDKLIVLDGHKQTAKEASIILSTLEPNAIYSVTVLKGPDAINKYGELGKNGVIEIITKSKSTPADTRTKPVEENKVFEKVETDPSFPGGDAAWKQYLQKNANALVPVDNGAPAGTYKTIIQFIVHTDGSISDIKPLTSHGFGMENEAKRLIEKGPRWVPAKQNGHLVNAYVQQPVTFVVTEVGNDNLNTKQRQLIGIAPKISVKDLQNSDVFRLLQLPVGTEITGFTFTIDTDDDITAVLNKGTVFNLATQNLIAGAKPGRLITIDLITIKENGIQRKIPSRVYEIVN